MNSIHKCTYPYIYTYIIYILLPNSFTFLYSSILIFLGVIFLVLFNLPEYSMIATRWPNAISHIQRLLHTILTSDLTDRHLINIKTRNNIKTCSFFPYNKQEGQTKLSDKLSFSFLDFFLFLNIRTTSKTLKLYKLCICIYIYYIYILYTYRYICSDCNV